MTEQKKWPQRRWHIDFHAMRVLYTLPAPEGMHECIVEVMPIDEVESILKEERAKAFEEVLYFVERNMNRSEQLEFLRKIILHTRKAA
jgi:hypothetical protein